MLTNYFNQESQLISDFKAQFLNTRMITKTSEVGSVVKISGKLFNHLIFHIDFPTGQRKYDISVGLKAKYLTFESDSLLDTYNKFYQIHNNLTSQYESDKRDSQLIDEESKQEQLKKIKAEEAYQRAKERSVKKFKDYTHRTPNINDQSGEFFFTLGWLAKHIGTVSATLPDYLNSAFEKHFGAGAIHTVVDSIKNTSGGFPMQYSWSFKASLPGAENIPNSLDSYLNGGKTAITNTGFIWDLVDTYNFKFGRRQDVNDILTAVPLLYKDIFKEGFES